MFTIALLYPAAGSLASTPIRSADLRVNSTSPVTATPAGVAVSAAVVAAFVGGFNVGQALGKG